MERKDAGRIKHGSQSRIDGLVQLIPWHKEQIVLAGLQGKKSGKSNHTEQAVMMKSGTKPNPKTKRGG